MNPGFATSDRFTASMALALSRYQEPARRLAFYEALGGRLWVTREARQIGIRLALGATAGDVGRLVFRMGLVPVSAGASAGLPAAAALSRLVSGLLFGISPTDPMPYAAIGALLFAVAFTACALPARRAAAADPAQVLRSD